MFDVILLLLAILGLVLGTELIIRGSLNIAEHFKISHLFIGLTILAVGTDLPELFVNISGAIHRLQGTETSGIIVGQIIGTCLGQIALTLGILSLFARLTLRWKEITRDGIMMILSVVLFLVAGLDGAISRIEGVIFLLVYASYFYTIFKQENLKEKIQRAPKIYTSWAILSLISGFAILIYCSNLIVVKATQLAETWGIAQSFIGIILVGLGTSLPELTVSLNAIRKGAFRLSIGNLIGSNIFDILFSLGISTAISGFIVDKNLLIFDIPFLLLVSIAVVAFFRRNMQLDKYEGIALISIYIFYIGFKFWNL